MANPLRGANRQWVYCAESVIGTTPTSPTTKYLRCLPSTNFKRAQAMMDSRQADPSRQRQMGRLGQVSATGQIDTELSPDTYTDFFAAVLEADAGLAFATAITKTATTISASSTDNSFNDSGSGFVSAGFVVGDLVYASTFSNSANNGLFLITSLTAGKMIVAGQATLVTEAAGSNRTIRRPQFMKPGKTLYGFTFEDQNTDVSASGGCGVRYPGSMFNQMNFKVSNNGLVTVGFNLLARDGIVSDQVVASTISAANGDNSLNDSANGFGAFQAGDVIRVTGFTAGANNTTMTVVTASAAKLIVSGATLTTEAAGNSITITERLPTPGTAMSTTLPFPGIATGSLFIEGSTFGEGVASSVGVLADFSLTASNGLKALYAVTNTGAAAIEDDTFTVSGQLSVYAYNLDLLKKFVNQTATALEFMAYEASSGAKFRILLPYILYTGGDMQQSGLGALSENLPFSAYKSPIYDTTMIIMKE